MSKPHPLSPELVSWIALNDAVMATTDERALHRLLVQEQGGKRRKQFMARIHSRLNKVRADRERAELAR